MKLSYIEDIPVPTADLYHLLNTILEADRWDKNDNQITIVITSRRPDGWLEYGINVQDTNRNLIIYIGAIQRSTGAPSEFHS